MESRAAYFLTGSVFAASSPPKPRAARRSRAVVRTVTPSPEAQPFTVEHFRAWASGLLLDTDQPWIPEPFQEAYAADLFSGIPEAWLVVPEGNGKTTLLAGIALYHCEFQPFAVVPVAAASREQAEIMYRQAEGFVLRSPRLHELVHSPIQEAKGKRKTDVPRFLCLEGYRRINHHAGGRIQVFAADDRTGDGIIPTLGIIDEPHRQRDLSLYRTWSGKLAKRKGQIAAISTAGEPTSDFEVTRQRIRQGAEDLTREGAFLRAKTDRLILHDWALPEDADPDDIVAVKGANPFSGITVEMLTEKHGSMTMTRHHWLRFVCNRPTEDDDVWLGPNARLIWGDLRDPYLPKPKALTWVGLDVGIKRDSTALVAIQKRPDGHFHAWCRLWVPTEDKPVDVTDVMQELRRLAKDYRLAAVSFDPRLFDVPAKMLADEGLPMREVPQSAERMTGICGDALEVIKRGELHHDGDEAFSSHVLSAVPRFNGRGFTLEKSKSHGRIDAAIALVLAIQEALHHSDARLGGWAFVA